MFASLKKVSTGYLAISLFSLVFGILLCVDPLAVPKITCYAIGGALVIYGLVRIINFLVRPSNDSGMTMGVLAVVIGILIVAFSGVLINSVPMLFGLLLIANNASNIQTALLMRVSGAKRWWVDLLLALGMLGVGIFLLCCPGFITNIVMYLVGAGLILNAIFNLVIFFSVRSEVKRAEEVMKDQETTVVVED